MDNLYAVDNLISEIETEIAKGISTEISESKNLKYIEYSRYLKNIREKLAFDSYKFIFIGDKGIGKTTTILELFGLVGIDGDLLTTASGGTTTCEVEILKSDKDHAYFEIIPISDSIMEQYVDDFCQGYKPKEEDDDSSDIQYVPSEIARSIRNMLGMKKNEIKQYYDTCESYDEFVKSVFNKLNLENRNDTIIDCNTDSAFKDIQKKFNEINLCKIQSVKLPSKIRLYLTKDIFDFSKHPYIHSIVDTRGIDSNISSTESDKRMKREDIINYIDNEQEKCIFLFMDGIKPAPSPSILNVFLSRITKENMNKFYLMVNIYDNQAEEVMTDDGKAQDAQVGIDYKKDDILEKFTQNTVNFIDSNLLFYNARRNFPEKSDILGQIKNSIDDERKKLFSTCAELNFAFEKLKYDFENKEYALKNFEELYSIVLDTYSPQNTLEHVINSFVDNELRNLHHARIHALNRYDGNYYAYNFYYWFSITTEQIFDEVFLDAKNNVIKKVLEFFGYKNINDIDKIDYKIYIEKLEKDYIGYRNALKTSLKQMLESTFRSQRWVDAVNQYGRNHVKVSGEPPYTARVLGIYREEMLRLAISHNIKSEYDARWQNILQENNLKMPR